MSHFIGATGLDIFNDAITTAIEETTITLTDLIDAVAIQDNLNAIYSSNYSDKVGIFGSNYTELNSVYSSNYADKVGIWGSNYTDREISYTSNYVLSTSNIIVQRIRQLEGSEGSAGDPEADPPIPPIPPTGNFAILATLATLTAGASALAIVVADLTDDVNNLDDKVDLQALYSSNYSDKVGVWGSNYSDKVGIYGSNYTDKIGIFGSNYSDKIGIFGSNYTDKVGIWGSNYTDKIGIFGSNYTDKVGIWGSNYTDKVGIFGSNYTDRVGIFGSNYTDRVGIFGSNYTERLIAGLGTVTNYWTEESTNNIYLNKSGNVGIGTIATTKLHIYQDTINDTKLIIQNNKTTSSPPADIVVSGLTSTTIGNDKILSFPYTGSADTKDYSFTTTEILVCDILVIGGGGGGGKRHGGGGGAGTLMYHKNIILNGTYNIKVGKGGAGNTSTPNTGNANDGIFSQFTRSDGGQNYYAVGGGRATGASGSYANTNGGQGYLYDSNLTLSSANIFNGVSVAVSNKQYVNTLTSPEGCRGNIGGRQLVNYTGGGGGGAGGIGMDHDSEASVNDGYGGLGLAVDITGASVVYAGGGNGGDYFGSVSQVFDPTYNTIQLRGGGGYGSDNGTPQNGLDGTGGGGGGQGNDIGAYGAKGGDGIVIIRYRLGTSSSSSLELVRGTTTDGNIDYSVGNYDGSFKVKSVVNTGTPSDRLVISSAGNVDIAGSVNIPTGSTYKINGVDISTTFTPTSANTIGIFNSTQFENVSSLIQIKSSWKPTTAGTADTANGLSAGTSISITSITASGLITGNAGLTISGAGQSLISEGTITARIINASGLITGNAGLTIPAGQTLTSLGTLTATTIIASELITANAGLTIASAQTLTSGVINASGLITATQTTTGTNDILNMRYNSTNGIRFQQRYIGTDDVGYDIIQKVANVDKTASLSFYNGNVGIGRTTLPTRILQVGTGRLGIANDNTQFTIIGTSDVAGELHTKILLFGVNCTDPAYGGTGNILYLSGNGGKHVFITLTPSVETERMRIGNNGNVAIGTTDTATYKLNVAGDINVSGAFRVGGTALANSWSAGTPTTNIYYNLGNVGIGATTTSDVDDNTAIAIPTARLYVRGGESAGGTCDVVIRGGVAGQNNGKARILLAGDSSHSSFIQSEHTGNGNTQLTFGTANGNTLPTERMKIWNNGAVGIQDAGNWGIAQGMTAGSLSIGNGTQNYGYQSGVVANMSGLLMECVDYTEIAVHDAANRVASFMAYFNNKFLIGRNMGWGSANVAINNALAIGGDYIPQYTLDIPLNGTGSSGSLGLRYFNYDTNIAASVTTLNNVSARIGGSIWCGSWIASSSDSRIKEDIQDINDDSALQMILAIEPKTYKYIDKVAKGDKKVYGFIAQQIKQVLPDAIGIEPEYIPNIMLLADYDNDIITLPSQPVKVVIKLNDKIRCYDKDNKHIDIIVIEIIDELTFKIKFNDNTPSQVGLPIKAKEPINNSSLPEGSGSPEGPSNIDITDSPKYTDNKIFVSGTEVDDFHTISKEYIFTLNVCATQELHRRIISQEERIKELEEKVERLLSLPLGQSSPWGRTSVAQAVS